MKVWPSNYDEVVPGDGRQWQAFDAWLRKRGSSLSDQVAAIRGYARQEWSEQLLKDANAVVLAETGKRAHSHSGTLGLPPGMRWDAAFVWMWSSGLDPDTVLGEKLFDLDSFRAYLRDNNLESRPQYNKLYKSRRLDHRCPGNPMVVYKIGWREIVGRNMFSRSEFERYLSSTVVPGYDITGYQGYNAAYAAGLLSPRCPQSPYSVYEGWKWGRKAPPWNKGGEITLALIEQKLREVGPGLFRNGRRWLQRRVPGDPRKWGVYQTAARELGTTIPQIAERVLGRNKQEAVLRATRDRAKLTMAEARKMRDLSKKGWTGVRLAQHFGVSTAQVTNILRGRQWRE